MPLDCVCVHRDHLVEGVQRDVSSISTRFGSADVHIPDVVIPVGEELSENVDSHNSQSAICLNLENSQDRLV
jgi:hypothetical protein